MRFAPLVFVRPAESANGTEMARLLRSRKSIISAFPPERMKMREQHMRAFDAPSCGVCSGSSTARKPSVLVRSRTVAPYVFQTPEQHQRAMSRNAVLAASQRMGYTKEEWSGHGFRSMASTLLHEQGWSRQAIERQLAHAQRDAGQYTYDFTEHLPERRE